MYSYCSSMYSYCCLCILIVVYVFLDAATLTEVFPCFFLGCKVNARVILAKTGHGPHTSKIVVLFYVLFVLYRSMYCLCVNVYCHRMTTQLQLTNISIRGQYVENECLKAESHIACRAHAAPMPFPYRSPAMSCVNSHMPCRATALLRQCRVLRVSPPSSRKYPNC